MSATHRSATRFPEAQQAGHGRETKRRGGNHRRAQWLSSWQASSCWSVWVWECCSGWPGLCKPSNRTCAGRRRSVAGSMHSGKTSGRRGSGAGRFGARAAELDCAKEPGTSRRASRTTMT